MMVKHDFKRVGRQACDGIVSLAVSTFLVFSPLVETNPVESRKRLIERQNKHGLRREIGRGGVVTLAIDRRRRASS